MVLGLLRHLGCLLLGAAVGLAAVAVHRMAFPLGLVLVAAATFTTSWWLRGSRDEAGAATHATRATTYAAGWLLVFALVILGRPEGDYLVAGDPAGLVLIGCAVGQVVVGVVSLAGARRAAP